MISVNKQGGLIPFPQDKGISGEYPRHPCYWKKENKIDGTEENPGIDITQACGQPKPRPFNSVCGYRKKDADSSYTHSDIVEPGQACYPGDRQHAGDDYQHRFVRIPLHGGLIVRKVYK